jgi:uncharacterized membrane protein YhiD involved in acid resistance
MRTGSGIYGLTTAATIWVNAAVGVAAGGGEYRLALIATAVTLAVLLALYPLERIIDRMSGNSAKDSKTAPDREASDPTTRD